MSRSAHPKMRLGHRSGFNEQREVGPPVIEEAADKSRRIQRNELMHGTRRQTLFGKRRRGDGARSDKHREVHGAKPLDQGDDGENFADARAVQPNQRAGWPRQAGATVTFAEARRIFLAALEAPSQEPRCHRRCGHGRRKPITSQRERQPVAHALASPALPIGLAQQRS